MRNPFPGTFQKALLLPALLLGLTAALGAEGFRLRTFVETEPYSRLSSTNMTLSGSRTGTRTWTSSYSATPGVEFFVPLGSLFELGGGLRWQAPREPLESGTADARFSNLPVYLAARVAIAGSRAISGYAAVRAGYNAFFDTPAFRQIWASETGGALTSVSGGAYADASLGLIYSLTDSETAFLEFSLEAGYSIQTASAKNASKDFTLLYQNFHTGISLDWRF